MPRPILLSLLVVLFTAGCCDATPSTDLEGAYLDGTAPYYIRSATGPDTTPLLNISLATTVVTLDLYTDDAVLLITLPFPVQVYNISYTNVSVSTNGNVQLQGSSEYWLPTALPIGAIGVAIFAFQCDLENMDLAFPISLATMGDAPNRLAVVDWITKYYHAVPEIPMHFQVWFYENTTSGEFTLAYNASVAERASSCVVGIQQSSDVYSQYAGTLDGFARLDFALNVTTSTSALSSSSSSTGAASSSSTGETLESSSSTGSIASTAEDSSSSLSTGGVDSSSSSSSTGADFNSSSSSSTGALDNNSNSSSSSTGECVICAASQFAPHALTLLLLALALLAQNTFA